MVDVENFFLNESVYTILAMETNRTETEFDVIFYSEEFAETVAEFCVNFYIIFFYDELPF